MAPGAHFVMSWLSSVPLFKERRERIILTLAGISPDIDGVGIVIDKLSGGKTDLYFQYHHYFGHNLFFAIFVSILAYSFANVSKLTVMFIAFLLVHLHFLCDIIGSMGPDGYHWPIYYLYPINKSLELTWSGQWELNAWPNHVIVAMLLAVSFLVAVKKQFSFIEVISPRLDKEAFIMWHKYVKKNT